MIAAAPMLRLPMPVIRPVTIRLIGELDDVLVDAFAQTCARLPISRSRTLLVRLNGVHVGDDRHAKRLLAIVAERAAAGEHLIVEGPPAWRKPAARNGCAFATECRPSPESRRQFILCHSVDRTGAAR